MKLPTVDYGKALENPETAGKEIVTALHDPGFLFIKNIPGLDTKELYRWTKWFFSDLKKEDFDAIKAEPYRGFYYAIPHKASYKNIFETCTFEKPPDKVLENVPKGFTRIVQDYNKWPRLETKEGVEFKKFMKAYFTKVNTMAEYIIKMITLELKEPYEEWASLFGKEAISSLRLTEYPVRDHDIPTEAFDGHLAMTTGPHTDTPFLTLLCTFHFTGLQVQTADGTWVDAEHEGGDGLVMNIGDQMVKQFARNRTDGKSPVRATNHRVLDIGESRYSVPFFFEPRADAILAGESKPYGQNLIEGLLRKKYVEYAHLAKWLVEDEAA